MWECPLDIAVENRGAKIKANGIESEAIQKLGVLTICHNTGFL